MSGKRLGSDLMICLGLAPIPSFAFLSSAPSFTTSHGTDILECLIRYRGESSVFRVAQEGNR